jgi:hypothetical protein
LVTPARQSKMSVDTLRMLLMTVGLVVDGADGEKCGGRSGGRI